MPFNIQQFLSANWNQSARILLYPGALCCLLYPQPGLLLATGLLLFGLESYCFVQQADRTIDLRVLLRMAALLFMWVAPAMSYLSAGESWYTGYRMAVPIDNYFALILPATAALNLALSVPAGTQRIEMPVYNRQMGWWLLATGIITAEIIPYLPIPAGLRHVIFLISQLWLAGVIMLQQAYPKQRWIILIVSILYLTFTALRSTLFGYSIIWSVILFCYSLEKGAVAFRIRMLAALLLGLGILFLLSFKYEYRQQIWNEKRPEPAWRIFLETGVQRLLHPADLFRPEIIRHYTDRLNQGYHTAQAMAFVPAQTPYARGATLLEDVRAAILPRFLAPDKHRAGGAENIRRFSGIENQRWSSNIGHYGEAYVNFGVQGAWLVLLCYGLLISGTYALLRRYFFFPWWPFVLEPVLNVEQDIGMGLNHLSKGLLFVATLLVAFRILFRPL